MELLFHAGLNKAGSSYAQELVSYNYKKLLLSGIYYPNPKLSNSIAGSYAGNAPAFTRAIRTGQLKNASEFLRKHITAARSKNCSRLLLSNESLYHELVDQEKLASFTAVCAGAGITNTKILLIFRDPVSHAISAYNHRAGFHEVPPFIQWVRNGLSYEGATYRKGRTGYEFWEEISQFHDNSDAFANLGAEFAAYSSDISNIIEKFCGLSLEKPPLNETNVSPNCVEAELLRFLIDKHPGYARKLRMRLKGLSKKQKAPDNYIRYRNQVAVYECCAEVESPIANIRQLLADDQFVHPPVESPTELFDKRGEPYFLLSKAQLEQVISLFDENPAEDNLLTRALKRTAKKLPSSIKSRIKALLGRI